MNSTRFTFKHESSSCSVVCYDDAPHFTLVNLYSSKPRLGHAHVVLEMVEQWADQYDTEVHLTARHSGNPSYGTCTDEQLIKLYSKHGFVQIGNTNWMVRKPKEK